MFILEKLGLRRPFTVTEQTQPYDWTRRAFEVLVQDPDWKTKSPLQAQRYTRVEYFGYIGGVKFYGADCKVVEIQIDGQPKNYLSTDFGEGDFLVNDAGVIVPVNLDNTREDINPSNSRTFSDYGDSKDRSTRAKLDRYWHTNI